MVKATSKCNINCGGDNKRKGRSDKGKPRGTQKNPKTAKAKTVNTKTVKAKTVNKTVKTKTVKAKTVNKTVKAVKAVKAKTVNKTVDAVKAYPINKTVTKEKWMPKISWDGKIDGKTVVPGGYTIYDSSFNNFKPLDGTIKAKPKVMKTIKAKAKPINDDIIESNVKTTNIMNTIYSWKTGKEWGDRPNPKKLYNELLEVAKANGAKFDKTGVNWFADPYSSTWGTWVNGRRVIKPWPKSKKKKINLIEEKAKKYDKYTMPELKAILKKRGDKGYSKLNRKTLLNIYFV